MHLQPETAFRESYRIEGETIITVDDYTSGRVFDDAVPLNVPLKDIREMLVNHGAIVPE